MPQFGIRKVAYSCRQKRIQLRDRKNRKRGLLEETNHNSELPNEHQVQIINHQPNEAAVRSNRYALQFFKETDEEIEQRLEQAKQIIEPVLENQLEIDIDDYFFKELEVPKRPPWDYTMSKEEINAQETSYFHEYLAKIQEQSENNNLSYFELNLETWRQFWRVVEMSDIILIIVDIRFAALMFPPSLYKFIVEDLHKEMILVLNKIDLAPAELVIAWKRYFSSKFSSIHILTFTSIPSDNLSEDFKNKINLKQQRSSKRVASEGAEKLYQLCEQIIGSKVDLSSWKKKLMEEKNEKYANKKLEIEEFTEEVSNDASCSNQKNNKSLHDGVLTIGCIGHPNVGKSSLMNAIIGKKVVSVSKTPGHTKHFQTIFLTNNIRICDCSGFVFPSKVPKVLQILMGSYPVAQIREPYSPIKYIAERIDLVKLLNIQHPNNEQEWSSMDICAGWAKKRGFYTSRTARPDTHRAADNLLRLTLDGKICICLQPAGYSCNLDIWKNHPEIKEILRIQAGSELRNSQSNNANFDDIYDESASECSTDFYISNKFAVLGDVE